MRLLLRVLIAWSFLAPLTPAPAAGERWEGPPRDASRPEGAGARQTRDDPETRIVVAGERYGAGDLHRRVFGSDYRDLWTTPIEVEVLDLERTAGGLDPVMIVGRHQTLGLALRGADGRSYTFRSLDKDPTSVLAEELLGTPIADLAQDQISSNFPGAPLVAVPIARAAGVRQPGSRLVMMPDSPRLGEFRERFAGLLGTFRLYPTEGDWGIIEVIDSDELLERITSDADERIDDRAFLRARLVDLLIGDWDRHVGQWRWARYSEDDNWQPIPEDRDQAFSLYDGIAMSFQRNRDPRFDRFGTEYQPLEGLTWNGRAVDRRLLTGLGRDDWLEVARDVRRRLDDETLEAAVRALPEPWHRLRGEELLRRLRARRDALVGEAERFYEFLAGAVDVWGTNEAELFEIERLEDGGGVITAAAIAAPAAHGCRPERLAEPHYRRRFRPAETESVRIYTGAGDDRVVVRPDPAAEIDVKIVGDAGDNRLCVDGGDELVFDLSSRGRSGTGTEVAPRVWLTPSQPLEEAGTPAEEQGTPQDARRDWGSTSYTTPWFGAGPDIGLFLGMGWTQEVFAFRQRPYATRHTVRLGFSTGTLRPKLEYEGVYHLENRRPHFRARALVSGIETLNFFGVGNETPRPADEDFRRAKRNAVELGAVYVRPIGEIASISTGPVARFSQTQRDEDDLRLVNVLDPYGSADTFQAGWRAGLHYNDRHRVRPLRRQQTDDPARFGWPDLGRGFTADVDVAYYPGLLDLREDYLLLRGSTTAMTRIGVEGPGIGLRIGGQRNWGDAPYYDLALVGEEQVRGLQADRFAGDASVYGNVVAALPLGRIRLVVPGYWGVLVRGGVGRVYLQEGESSRWHWGRAIGLWWMPWNYSTALRVSVADSDEGVRAYLRLGFEF